MGEVMTRLVRKSLGTRLAEALTARGLTWEYGADGTGRLLYFVPEWGGPAFTPGELAAKLGIPVCDGVWP